MSQRRQRLREIRLKKLSESPYCLYCNARLRVFNSTIDHINPIAENGTDDESNLALCCERCNSCKKDRSLSQWIADLAAALNSTIPSVRRIR